MLGNAGAGKSLDPGIALVRIGGDAEAETLMLGRQNGVSMFPFLPTIGIEVAF